VKNGINFILLFAFLGLTSSVLGQAIWTGNVNSRWDVPGNWSTGFVPGAPTFVFIPDVANDPIIFDVGSPTARIVTVHPGAQLTIATGADFDVAGVVNNGTIFNSGIFSIAPFGQAISDEGLINNGTFTNNGLFLIDAIAINGINNTGTFNNNATTIIAASAIVADVGILNSGTVNHTAGIIAVDCAEQHGIRNTGTFFCSSTLEIGQGNCTVESGITNLGVFNKSSASNLKIDRTSLQAIDNQAGAIFNTGENFALGSTQPIGAYGIKNAGTFRVLAGSTAVTINRASAAAVFNTNLFICAGALTIGGISANGDSGIENTSSGEFQNNTGSNTVIDRATARAILNAGTFTNYATLTIGATASNGNNGIMNQTTGIFTNTSGTINLSRSVLNAINNAGTLYNNANINIGATVSAGFNGINNTNTFFNFTGAHITADRCASAGVTNSTGGVFVNAGLITLGGTAVNDEQGITNQGTFNNNTGGLIKIDRALSTALGNYSTFNNNATITIGSVANTGTYGIYNNATFNNNTGGAITVDNVNDTGIFLAFGAFSNAASVTLGQVGAVPILFNGFSGTFSNNLNGTVKASGLATATNFVQNGGTLSPGYSPGLINFNDNENFATGTLNIEVPNVGTPGVHYDQVQVNGTATLGGTLALNITHTPTNGQTVTILDATALSGTFATVTGLLPGWVVEYNQPSAGQVRLRFDAALPVELTAFSGENTEQGNLLTWKTAVEENSSDFEVMKSKDGLFFEKIASVPTKGSNSVYQYLDPNPSAGIHYYKLQINDADGTVNFSNIINIDNKSQDISITVYPNPTDAELTIVLGNQSGQDVSIFNTAGQLVFQQLAIPDALTTINVRDWASGVYYIQSGGRVVSFLKK
jgi:hypothetical protein